MIRRAFRIVVAGACLLSLLISLALCVAWKRGVSRGEWWMYATSYRRVPATVALVSDAGELSVHVFHGDDFLLPAGLQHRVAVPDVWEFVDNGPEPVSYHGFFFYRSPPSDSDILLHVACPGWAACGAFALPPLLWLFTAGRRRLVVRRRREKGRCIPCGYDLTGNESGTCPECGDVPTQAKRAT